MRVQRNHRKWLCTTGGTASMSWECPRCATAVPVRCSGQRHAAERPPSLLRVGLFWGGLITAVVSVAAACPSPSTLFLFPLWPPVLVRPCLFVTLFLLGRPFFTRITQKNNQKQQQKNSKQTLTPVLGVVSSPLLFFNVLMSVSETDGCVKVAKFAEDEKLLTAVRPACVTC